jgi:hypothetical protein
MRLYGFLSWILFATISLADPLDTWIWRNPLPTGNNVRAVVYGGGRFVSAGDMGMILVSTDATNWVDRSVKTSDTYGAIAYGNGRFVTVGGTLIPPPSPIFPPFGGGSAIVTSTDTTNWISANPGTTNRLLAVTFGNGQFVAVGENSTIVTSSDGLNWVKRPTNTSGDFAGVAYGNGLFMITVFGPGLVLVSPDGVNWSPRSSYGIRFQQITFGGGVFLAQNLTGNPPGGVKTQLAVSVDGSSWTSVIDTVPNPAFTYDGTKFILIQAPTLSQSNAVYTSTDGSNWTTNFIMGLPQQAFKPTQLAFGNGAYVAVLERIYRSDNLLAWTLIRSSLPISAARVLLTGNGKMVLAGTGPILVSTNGFDFKTNATSGTFNAGAFGTNTFILASGGGSIVTSTNGSDWTARVTGGSSINALAYGSNTFITVGANGDIRVSASGTGWSGRFSGTTLGLNGIAYRNGVFVAVGSNGVVLTSPDTINWTIQDAGTIATLWSIIFGNGVFVATGDNGTLRVSSDGINWSAINSGTTETLRSSAATRGNLLVAGITKVLSSTDGSNWTPRFAPLDVSAIGTTPNTFVLMGASTNIVESGSLSPIVMSAPSYTLPGAFHVKVTGDPGTTARLQRLTNPSNWIDVLTYTNSGAHMPLTDNGATNSAGIYRVVSP